MCCIPCARPPVADEEFWKERLLPYIKPNEADIVMGFCPRMFMLIGSCSSAIHELYSGVISMEEFVEMRQNLIPALEQACDSLPMPKNELKSSVRNNKPDAQSVTDLNACISAAIAQSLATRIFLLRATDTTDPHGEILELTGELRGVAESIPVITDAMTTMLWPLFVLGCEMSYDVQEREKVVTQMKCMLTRNRIMNVERCLEALRDVIWAADDDVDSLVSDDDQSGGSVTSGLHHIRQVGWVRFCWENEIELCLA